MSRQLFTIISNHTSNLILIWQIESIINHRLQFHIIGEQLRFSFSNISSRISLFTRRHFDKDKDKNLAMQKLLPKLIQYTKHFWNHLPKLTRVVSGAPYRRGNQRGSFRKRIQFSTSETYTVHVFWQGVLEGSFGYPKPVSQKGSQ